MLVCCRPLRCDAVQRACSLCSLQCSLVAAQRCRLLCQRQQRPGYYQCVFLRYKWCELACLREQSLGTGWDASALRPLGSDTKTHGDAPSASGGFDSGLIAGRPRTTQVKTCGGTARLAIDFFVRLSAIATTCEQPSLSISFPSSRVQPWCEAQPLARRIKPSGRHLAERG